MKFYNQQDKEIFRQKIMGVQVGLLDENTLEIIKKTETRLLRTYA